MHHFRRKICDYPRNHRIIIFSSRQMRSAGSAQPFTSHPVRHPYCGRHSAGALFQGPLGRKCVTTSHSNDCLLCRAHFKPGASCQAIAQCQVLGLGDSNCFSHILAVVLMPRVCLCGKFGLLAGVVLTGAVISAGPGDEIRPHISDPAVMDCFES